MAIHKIQHEGSSVLSQVATEVTNFDVQLEMLIEDMQDTMRAHDGIGLAAPQIGKSTRVIVLDFEPFIMINPEIVETVGTQIQREGCLSFPKLFFNIERPKKVLVCWQDISEFSHIQEFEDLQATAVQHEIDHLNGKVFTQYVKPMTVLLEKKKLKTKGPKK